MNSTSTAGLLLEEDLDPISRKSIINHYSIIRPPLISAAWRE